MDIGVDLTTISRFIDVKERFIKRVLTSDEYADFLLLPQEKKASFLAVHWAVKEALFKITQDKNYLSYTIKHMDNGKPYILNHDNFKVSISHESDMVIAVVLKLD